MLSLRTIAERYRLEIGGVGAWAPYWINSGSAPFWLNAPYRGKVTPGQLQAAAQRLVVGGGGGEQARQVMHDHGLGVDCSGFAYYVLDQWWRADGHRLGSALVVDRVEILERNERRPEFAKRWGARPVPDTMALDEACRIWRKNPIYITNVARLGDERVATRIASAVAVRPGDLIRMSNRSGDHVAVVLEVAAGRIVYADSAMEQSGLGGVSEREIRVVDPTAGLELQDWEQKRLFHPHVSGSQDGVWRLRCGGVSS